jgi:hypothetical protein
MSAGWSESDKKVVKVALTRARKCAEEMTLQEFHNLEVRSLDDIWALEQKIRKWRRDAGHDFCIPFDHAERFLHDCLKRGWCELSDLRALSEKRLETIRKG